MKFNIKEWQDKHLNENNSSAKLIRQVGWEIDLLLKDLAKNKFGQKVEKWTEDNKDKRLGPAVVPFQELLDKLKQMKKIL